MAEPDEWEPDEDFEMPALDEPDQRLHFDELHLLVQDAASGAWDRHDYPDAVRSGWNALRDLLRQRLGSPQLDGVELVDAIGERNPRLPLTDYVTESDHNMHRGLVQMLRGVVFYVRNPEMHETESPVEGDRVGAFERLALMSLVARHVAAAASPVAVEVAVAEASQALFPRTNEAADELISTVPRRLHPDLVEQIGVAAKSASGDKRDEVFLVLAFLFRRFSRRADPAIQVVATRTCSLLIADDTTIQVGARLLVGQTYLALPPRHRAKVTRFIADSLTRGRIEHRIAISGAGSLQAANRLIRVMSPDERMLLVHAATKCLHGEWSAQAFGTRVAVQIEPHVSSGDREELARQVAKAIAVDNSFGARDELETAWPFSSTVFQVVAVGALRDAAALAADPEAVEDLIGRLDIADPTSF